MLFAAIILAFCAGAEPDGWDSDYYAEISAASQHFSLGSVRADKSVWILEGDVVQRLNGFGHVLAGYWAQSDFENRRDSGHRSTVYESDPYLFYGYDWEFAEGWRLRNRAGMIWVFNEGYRKKVVHLNAINHPTRVQIRESRRHGTTRKTDACFVTLGVMLEL